MDLNLRAPRSLKENQIILPPSKSISNRLLVLRHILGANHLEIKNLSKASDVLVLQNAIEQLESDKDHLEVDLKDAGTAFRFFTSLAARSDKSLILNGSPRMQERPIGPLVDGLRALGARIIYLGREGYPPLYIRGSELRVPSEPIVVDLEKSSQFVSSLMMLAAGFDQTVSFHFGQRPVSQPYLKMTAAILEQFGVRVELTDSLVTIKPNNTSIPESLHVEGDWSSLPPLLAILCLHDEAHLYFPGLNEQSIQGDDYLLEVLPHLGLEATFDHGLLKVVSRNSSERVTELNLDLLDYPDLAQSLAVACLLREIPFHFTGLQTLRIKESDRIADMITVFEQLGVELVSDGDDLLCKDPIIRSRDRVLFFDGRNDHRLVMALSALATEQREVHISGANCVGKSFPAYFDALSSIGYEVSWQNQAKEA